MCLCMYDKVMSEPEHGAEEQLSPAEQLDRFLEGAEFGDPRILAANDHTRRAQLEEFAKWNFLPEHDRDQYTRELTRLTQEAAELGTLRRDMQRRTEEIPGYGHAVDTFKPIHERLFKATGVYGNATPDGYTKVREQVTAKTKPITNRPAPTSRPQ